MLRKIFYILVLLIFISGCSGTKQNPSEAAKTWPPQIQKITYLSSADNTYQPALFFTPKTKNAKPLLIALHQWSDDYLTVKDIPYAEWCIKNNWVFVHPNFRGPNSNPEATGSALAIQDIIDSINYCKSNSNIDDKRIYLIGLSGGGMMALIIAGKYPDIWAGISIWCPIYDLAQWYNECSPKFRNGLKNACYGTPEENPSEYLARSPSTYLINAKNVNIDINAGIYDTTVPISHAIQAFNCLAKTEDRISLSNDELLQKQSNNVRLTIFNGAHEIFFKNALDWLALQNKN
jgi:predicted esterase